MNYSIESDSLLVTVQKTGAELCSVISKENGTEYIWQANPDVWGSHSPVLFPVIGGLKEGKFLYNNDWFEMPKHGIVRRNECLVVEEKLDNSVRFLLKNNEDTDKMYPFDFEFRIQFLIHSSTLVVSHQILNTGEDNLLFSLGGHPAFNCPLHPNSSYEDYYLHFEKTEYAKTHLLDMDSGLVSENTQLIINNSSKLPLHKHLFDRDALIFKNLKSDSVSLVHHIHGKVLSLNFKDFPYLGIWAKPGADFVCIEPWLGIADKVSHNQKLRNKEGIISLNPNNTFSASYEIDFFNSQ